MKMVGYIVDIEMVKINHLRFITFTTFLELSITLILRVKA